MELLAAMRLKSGTSSETELVPGETHKWRQEDGELQVPEESRMWSLVRCRGKELPRSWTGHLNTCWSPLQTSDTGEKSNLEESTECVEAVCECGAWGASEAGDLDVGLSLGAVQPRGWREKQWVDRGRAAGHPGWSSYKRTWSWRRMSRGWRRNWSK